jgi:hypothetical protein
MVNISKLECLQKYKKGLTYKMTVYSLTPEIFLSKLQNPPLVTVIALTTHIRLDCKCLVPTNTLDY